MPRWPRTWLYRLDWPTHPDAKPFLLGDVRERHAEFHRNDAKGSITRWAG